MFSIVIFFQENIGPFQEWDMSESDFFKCMFIVKPLIEILIVPDFEEKILQNGVYVISWLN